MSRRGSELRDHILYAAKEVFLEVGFERASMDVIAARAQTSKRTLYAHFESKEKLYLAIIEVVCELAAQRLQSPGDYAADPIEALTLFCGRYLEGLLFVWTIRICRMTIAEAERFPEGSARYFEAIFAVPQERLSAYLTQTFGLPETASRDAAQRLLGQIISPRFQQTLFGIEPPSVHLGDTLRADFDLAPIRRAVVELMPLLSSSEVAGHVIQ